jgi:predicted RNA polymerase sigma factor
VARTVLDTDWPEIVRLYDLLLSVQPANPAAALGRAVALAEAAGPAAGQAALDALPASARDHRCQAVRAEPLARQGDYAAARAVMLTALDAQPPAPERAHRLRRLSERAQR